MRTIGTASELERRRRRAVQLVEQGESPTVVARILGVHVTSIPRWRHSVRRTFAPRGQTPVLDCWDRRDRISAITERRIKTVKFF